MIGSLARHPTAANLLMALFLVVGGIMAMRIERESMPDITPAQVQVQVVFLGGSPEEIEESICRPIEDAVESVQGIESIDSQAVDGVGIVTIEKTSDGDIADFAFDIDTEVSAITSFPDDAEDPVITQLGRDEVVLAILVGGFSDATDLYAYSDDLATRLRRLADVSTVDLEGFSDRQLRVELDAEMLMRYSLSVADVALAISDESVDRPVGSIDTREAELTLRFTERKRTPRDLEELVVRKSADGGEVLIGDLGVVRDLFEDAEDRIEVNGKRVGRLVVNKSKTDDAIDVSRAVHVFLEEERERVPPGVLLWTTEDSTEGLLNQLAMVITNGWQGMLLVFGVMWLFFTPRLAFWVVMSLPVSFLGAFILMPMFGATINTFSLIGFLLALGILMDDGIVIAENVVSHMQRGKSATQAAIDGTVEVLPGVLSSFLTTLCVLGPLALLDGDIGTVLGAVPVVLALVLTISLVEAFCILPSHLGHSLSGRDPTAKNRFRRAIDGAFGWVRDQLVTRAARASVTYRYAFVGVVAAGFIVAVGLVASGRVGFQAFPPAEGDVVTARVMMPPGTPLERTQEVVAQILAGLEATEVELSSEQPAGKKLVELASVRFSENEDADESGPHLATVSVDLLTTEERGSRMDAIKRTWRERTGDVVDALAITFAEATRGPAGRAIEVKIVGDDLEELDRAAQDMIAWFGQFDGTSNLYSDLRPGKGELRFKLKAGAGTLGLTANDIAEQVSAAFLGRVADEVQIGSEDYEVDVRLRDADRQSLDDLTGFRVKLPEGGEVALGTVAEITPGRGWSRIARSGGRRTVTVTGDIDASISNTTKVFQAFEEEFVPQLGERYPGLELDLDGETAEGNKTMASMLLGMLIGILGVYTLLSLQFHSYTEPLLVMVLIPLALIGVLTGHLLLSYPFTLPSMLGYIALAGIVVNDSILLVLFTKSSIEQGNSAHDAAVQASQARFRAVFLTSVTTIVGLLPLLREPSIQAQMVKGLVISVTFGMMASTVLVLLVIPALYAILEDCGLTRSHQPPVAGARSH